MSAPDSISEPLRRALRRLGVCVMAFHVCVFVLFASLFGWGLANAGGADLEAHVTGLFWVALPLIGVGAGAAVVAQGRGSLRFVDRFHPMELGVGIGLAGTVLSSGWDRVIFGVLLVVSLGVAIVKRRFRADVAALEVRAPQARTRRGSRGTAPQTNRAEA